MSDQFTSIGDFMREDEERLLAETRAEIAREKAEWDALTPAQQAEIIAAREAKFADVPDFDDCDDPDEDEEDDPCPIHRRPLSMCPASCREA